MSESETKVPAKPETIVVSKHDEPVKVAWFGEVAFVLPGQEYKSGHFYFLSAKGEWARKPTLAEATEAHEAARKSEVMRARVKRSIKCWAVEEHSRRVRAVVLEKLLTSGEHADTWKLAGLKSGEENVENASDTHFLPPNWPRASEAIEAAKAVETAQAKLCEACSAFKALLHGAVPAQSRAFLYSSVSTIEAALGEEERVEKALAEQAKRYEAERVATGRA